MKNASRSLAWKLHTSALLVARLSVGGLVCLLCLLAVGVVRFYENVPPTSFEVDAIKWGIPVVSSGLVAVCVLRWLQWLYGGTTVFEGATVSGGRPQRR